MVNYFTNEAHIDSDSITYIKEHLIIHNVNKVENLRRELIAQINELVSLEPDLLLNCEITIQTNHTAIFRNVKTFPYNISELFHAIKAADFLEMKSNFLISNRVDFPSMVLSYVSHDNACNKNYFYSYYQTLSDAEEDPHNYLAFGVHNGYCFNGLIPFADIDKMESNNCWSTPWDGIICEVQHTNLADQEILLELTEQLSVFSRENILKYDQNNFCFHTKALELHNKKEIDKYLSLAEKLQTAADQIDIKNECLYMVEFCDISGADPMILRLTQLENNTWRYQIAKV